MKGFGDSNAGASRRAPRMSDVVDIVEWPEDEYMDVRLIGPVFSTLDYWVTIKTQKNPKQPVCMISLDHDGINDKTDNDICPFRKSGIGREGKSYYVNVIVRDLQDGKKYPAPKGKPETHMDHEAFWASKGDTKKTPVRVLQLSDKDAGKLKDMMKLNRVKNKRGETVNYELSDERFGCDLQIKKTKNKNGRSWDHDIQKGDRSPLTDEERDYLLYRMDLLKPLSVKAAEAQVEDLKSKLVVDDKNKKKKSREDDDDDDDENIKRSKKRSRDDDEDDELLDMNDDDEDDEKPAKKKKRPSDDDEEDDEKPVKKKTSRKSRDDDEDEDLDDDDEEEKPTKKKSKRKSDDDEDDDDDLDDDLDDDDEEEKPRSKKSSKRSRDDDDDDDDNLDDDLDDEDDERPAKKKSSSRRR